MLAATVELVAEGGYTGLTVAGIVARARLSRRTFYELFRDREDCFLAVFEETGETVRPQLAAAFTAGGSWSEGVRFVLARLLSLIDEEPALARLWIVEALGAGRRVLTRRAVFMSELAAVLDEGRALARMPNGPSKLTAEAMTGAVFAVIHGRVALDPPAPVLSLYEDLAALLLLPYLGAATARRQARGSSPLAFSRARDVAAGPDGPDEQSAHPTLSADPLADLDMRLTYRTLIVLRAIATGPGASNRQIGERGGISDQGQVSKLLSRLARLGLAVNRRAGRGGPNSWHLTSRGEELERSTRAH